jgi:membrane associated rhomboid family serine protease
MIPLKAETRPALRPAVTITVISLCTVIFLWQRTLDVAAGRRVVAALGAVPAVLLAHARLPPDLQWVPTFVPVFTSMFLHGGWMHLLGNMLFLWIYGANVENSMGHVRFAIFYLLCGVAAIFTQALPEPFSPYPIIGASGAISGVLGAYLLLFPRANVLTLVLLPFFVTTLRLPAMLLLLLWFAVQLISDLVVPDGGASVAFRAHIGGFIAGVLLVGVFKRGDVPLLAP